MADDSDDGLMLNILQPAPKQNIKRQHPAPPSNKQSPSKAKKHKPDESGTQLDLEQKHGNPIQKKQNRDPHRPRKTKYIPASEFTPISSLFNKNPEIPTLPPEVESSTKEGEATSVFSGENFEDLPIHAHLISNLKANMNFTKMTQVQKLSLPLLLAGRDVLVKSATGSGKTMCYALAIIARLMSIEPRVSRADGAHAVVVVPTRELAQQCFNVFQELCRTCVWLVPGLLIGGDRCKSEKARLRKGVNVIVATPGRLLYHFAETVCLDLARVRYVVLDEADKLLDMGFEKQVLDILSKVNERSNVDRQNVLLSATLNRNVEGLAALSLGSPVFVDAYQEQVSEMGNLAEKLNKKPNTDTEQDDSDTEIDNMKREESNFEMSIPDTLQQSYVIVPAKLRLVTLMALIIGRALRKHKENNKMIVFMSSKQSVDFHYAILTDIVVDFAARHSLAAATKSQIYKLHGDMPQTERVATFEKFSALDAGVLLCTDVASRGLDIPRVNWIVQYTCAPSTDDYVHRVGRTARIGSRGKSLLFLLPSETGFREVLSARGFVLHGTELNRFLRALLEKKLRKKKEEPQNELELAATSLQLSIEESLLSAPALMLAGRNAYLSFIRGYATYPAPLKPIFHVRHLHLGHVAKSFGLRDAPQGIAEPHRTSQVAARKEGRKERERSVRSEVARKMQGKSEEAYYRDELIDGPRPGMAARRKQLAAGRKKKLRF